MTFNEYQEKAAGTDISMQKIKENSQITEEALNMLSLSYYSLGLGEVGEIQGKVKKILRDNGGEITLENKEDLKKEIGDCFWYLSNLAKFLNIKLNDLAQANLDKLYSRLERGVISGSGDNR